MPDAGRTHGPPATRNAGGSHHRFGRFNRHSLRDGLRLIRDLPGVPGLIAPVACGMSAADLAPASGRQDHAISPSAIAPLALRHQHVHRIPDPTSVAIGRNAPLGGSGWARAYI